eukprot:gene17950-20444_t
MSQTRAATARLARIQSRHPQAAQYFTEGVGSALRQWTALELAVHHQWGGPQSAERAEALVKDIVDLFVDGDDVWKDDVEILLEEYMEVCFNTICEDDSLEELGIKFCDMWKECIEGKTDMVSTELSKEYQRHEMVSRSEGLDTGDADDGSDAGEMNEETEKEMQEAVAQALSAGGEGMEIE